MSEENKVVEDQDRLALKQERKERKLLKKALKREERNRENDRKQLELKFGAKDQHITVISKDTAKSINKPNEIYSCSNNTDFNINNINNSFPVLDNVIKSKHKHVKKISPIPTSSTTNAQRFQTKQAKINTLTINLTDILTKPKPLLTQKTTPKEIEKYSGNILDSSQPERHKGKHREVPKSKPPTKLKSQIIADMKDCTANNVNLSNFCDNVITDELNNIVKEFLCSIVRFQENLYKRDPIKGTARRRYITGFREVKKYLYINKIKFLIVAPNIKNVVKDGALDTVVHELISLATENNIPYVFALSRRKLGHITLKKIAISCVGVFYYDGAEQLFNDILKLLESLRKPNENNKLQKYETVNEVLTIVNTDDKDNK